MAPSSCPFNARIPFSQKQGGEKEGRKAGPGYLLHALHGLLQELELLVLGDVLLRPEKLLFLLFQQLHFVPIGVQLPAQTVVLFFKSVGLRGQGWKTNRMSWSPSPSC